MNISKENMISPDQIMSDVLKSLNDESFKDNSKGYYTSLIQQALQELAFDTFFDERTESIDITKGLNVPMPMGSFNLKSIYLYNGSHCDFSKAQNVYWKRNFYSNGISGVSSSINAQASADPFYKSRRNRSNNPGSPENLFFYNIQRGMIMLSQNCSVFGKLMIVFSGTGGDVGEKVFIPQFLREAVKSWVIDSALTIKMAMSDNGSDFNKWQTLWSINDKKLRKPYTGIWDTAELRVKSMDSKARKDMKEYMSRLDY